MCNAMQTRQPPGRLRVLQCPNVVRAGECETHSPALFYPARATGWQAAGTCPPNPALAGLLPVSTGVD